MITSEVKSDEDVILERSSSGHGYIGLALLSVLMLTVAFFAFVMMI